MTSPYAIWILISIWLVCTGWILSCFHQLNAAGYLFSLVLLGAVLFLVFRHGQGKSPSIPRVRPGFLIRRFRRPLPLIYVTYLLLSLAGGTLWPPSNYDALCYRLPRILHWWSQNGWHWIGGYNIRMDYSATGFEWLAAPLLILLRSDRPIFFINLISYALMPGLIFALLRGLGIGRRVSWAWMWILPTAYCFVLQAGSIGNDMFATDYFLASAVFALRAAKSGSWTEAGLSILAAALMTGAKASNLPLLLPLGFLIIPLGRTLMTGPARGMLLVIVAGTVSFLPMALINLRHTGDWTGDPSNSEKMKLSDPVAGLVGNSLQTLVGVLLPPVFPMAKQWNASIEPLMERVPLCSIKSHYPRFTLSVGELATEEGAGFGPGILLLCLTALVFVPLHGCRLRMNRPALVFGGLCWAAFLVFTAKIGSESSARLASPYYVGLAVPFIALHSHHVLTRRRWWMCLAAACSCSVLPAVLMNPARPIIPPSLLIRLAEKTSLPGKFADRIRGVYAVYGTRADNLAPIRDQLSPQCRIIGFAGTGNESEYSLWKPIGSRRVVDAGKGRDCDFAKVDCIVASEEGIFSRFGADSDDFARAIQGRIATSETITIFAGREAVMWMNILPLSNSGFVPFGKTPDVGKRRNLP